MLSPGSFQGARKKSPYFEGWYYKLQATDGRIFAFIPGISRSGADPHCFIQVIAQGVSDYIKYPLEAFDYIPGKLNIRVGDSTFTESSLHVMTDSICCDVLLTDRVPFTRFKYSTGIMGPFALVPLLECHHGVITVKSRTRGSIHYPKCDRTISLDGGMGYIEKDWGSVFPDPYIWSHAFLGPGGSFMLSAARVPVLGRQMKGLAAFLYDGYRLRSFTTYSGAAVKDITESSGGRLEIMIKTPAERLSITLDPGGTVALKAPEKMGMGREVRESVTGRLRVVLTASNGQQLYAGESPTASIEKCGDIRKLRP